MKKIKTPFLGVLIFVICIACSNKDVSENQTVNILETKIEFDFSNVTSQKSMSGFIHSFNNTSPSLNNVIPLQPNTWTFGDATRYNTVKNQIQSEHYILRLKGLFQEQNPTQQFPFEDWSVWESFIEETANTYGSADIYWSIWNEPDETTFWVDEFNGISGKELYFETYKRAYTVFKNVLGNDVKVGGPDLESFEVSWLNDFFDFCLSNSLEINFLTWHEFETEYHLIEEHLNYIHENIISNSTYTSLNIQKIFINEVIKSSHQYLPASHLSALFFTEKGGADGMCKSCWNDSTNDSNCWNTSLDGLLTPEQLPRSVWWVYKLYADGIQSRILTSSYENEYIGIGNANSNNTDEIQLLIGYAPTSTVINDAITSFGIKLNNLNSVSGFSTNNEIKISFYRIPNSGEDYLQEPIFIKEEVFNASNELFVNIENINAQEVYYLKINLNK